MEKMLGCPQEHLDFPIWYLKQRGLIERLESGYFAITADGVDKLGQDDLMLPTNRLLSESSMPGGSSAGRQRAREADSARKRPADAVTLGVWHDRPENAAVSAIRGVT